MKAACGCRIKKVWDLERFWDYIGVNYKKEETQNGEILELDKE